MIDFASRIDLDAVRNTPEARKELGRLKKATEEFEGVLVKMLVGQMRRSAGSAMLGSGVQAEIYGDFFDQAISDRMSRGRGLGLGAALFQNLEETALRQIAARNMLSKSIEPAEGVANRELPAANNSKENN